MSVFTRSATDKMAARELLMAAIECGDVAAVHRLIDSGVDVNGVTNRGCIPLVHAVELGNKQLVRLLLRSMADPNTTEKCADPRAFNGSALMQAAVDGWVGIGSLLISNKADVNLTDSNGYSALMLACGAEFVHDHEERHVQFTRMLLNLNADPNLRAGGHTALCHAARRGSFGCVYALLEEVDSSLVVDNALETACEGGYSEVAKLLIHSVDYGRRELTIAFFASIWKDSVACMNVMIHMLQLAWEKEGDDVFDFRKFRDEDGYTPIAVAASTNSLECLAVLLTLGADPNILCTSNEAPIELACGQDYIEVVHVLVSYHACLTTLALDHARRGGAYMCMEYLLEHVRDEWDTESRMCTVTDWYRASLDLYYQAVANEEAAGERVRAWPPEHYQDPGLREVYVQYHEAVRSREVAVESVETNLRLCRTECLCARAHVMRARGVYTLAWTPDTHNLFIGDEKQQLNRAYDALYMLSQERPDLGLFEDVCYHIMRLVLT